MKRYQKFRFGLGTVFGVLLTPGVALAQSLFHPLPITSCATPFVANMPGAYYVVTGNLSALSGEDCIEVMAPNVTIDLGGFTLTGAGGIGGVGIFRGANAAVVRNGTVTGFIFGVAVQANNANLSALKATGNGSGVAYFDSQGGMLLTSQMSGNSMYGVYIENSQNIRVVDNEITSNDIDGIWLNGASSSNTISFNNPVSANGYAGILLAQSNELGELGNPLPSPAICTPVTSPSQNNLIFANSGSQNALLGIGLQCGVALSNTVEANVMSAGTFGGYDGNLTCDANSWSNDTFNSSNQACVK